MNCLHYTTPGGDRLAAATTLLQRETIFASVMKHGIGGYMAGAWISESGLRWAADTMHFFVTDNPRGLAHDIHRVITCVRLETFFVVNNLNPGYIGFGNTFGENYGLSKREYAERLLARVNALLPQPASPSFSVDYIVFHNLSAQRSTVFRARGDKGHHVKYGFERDKGLFMFHLTRVAADNVFRREGAEVVIL